METRQLEAAEAAGWALLALFTEAGAEAAGLEEMAAAAALLEPRRWEEQEWPEEEEEEAIAELEEMEAVTLVKWNFMAAAEAGAEPLMAETEKTTILMAAAEVEGGLFSEQTAARQTGLRQIGMEPLF